MKAATILPADYLFLTEEDDYHMCLAHLIGEDKKYTNFYKKIGQDPNKFLIMDNGVIEGDPRPIEEIVQKALSVGADEIILPDVFMNMAETLDKSYEALQKVRNDFPNLRVMVVPQGESLEEWLECARIMLTWDIDTIGIPKVLVHLEGRDGRLNALEELGHSLRGLDIHLLGCWVTPIEILMIDRAAKEGRILPVRGVDSAIAYVYTRSGGLISDSDRPDSEPIEFRSNLGPRIDLSLLEANIDLWKEASDLGYDDVFEEMMKRLGWEG